MGCFLADLFGLLHAGDFSLSLDGNKKRDRRCPGDKGVLEVSPVRDRGRSGEATACIHT